MTLLFPNPSRSFDDFEAGVRFIGYDGMISVPFVIEKSALEQMGAIATTEASLLTAFDASRKMIYAVACKIYGQARQTSYRIKLQDMG